MGTILIYLLIGFILYNLIFKFIIPIYRTTTRLKRGFREMQEKINAQYNAQNPNQQNPREQQKTTKGDYIDFEEIKE